MLPGLRFLLATTLLTTSLVIFGLGAAALLKAASQETSNPNVLRALRDPFPPTDMPTLAMVRIDPTAEPVNENRATEPAAPDNTVQAAVTEDLTPPAANAVAASVTTPDTSPAPAPVARPESPATHEPSAAAIAETARTASIDSKSAEKPVETIAEISSVEKPAETKPAEINTSTLPAEVKAADPAATAALPEQSGDAAPIATKQQPLAKKGVVNPRAAQLAKARRQAAARAAAARRQAAAVTKQQSPFGF